MTCPPEVPHSAIVCALVRRAGRADVAVTHQTPDAADARALDATSVSGVPVRF